MTLVLSNTAKVKPRQHILAFLLVTSPGTIGSERNVRPTGHFQKNETGACGETLGAKRLATEMRTRSVRFGSQKKKNGSRCTFVYFCSD